MFNVGEVYLRTLPFTLRGLVCQRCSPWCSQKETNLLTVLQPHQPSKSALQEMPNFSYSARKHNSSVISLLCSPCGWLFSKLNLCLKVTSSGKSPLNSLVCSLCQSLCSFGFLPFMFIPVCNFTSLFACHCFHLYVV